MNGPESHPIVLLVVASIIVSCIGAGIFSVWAAYDVIPSSLDNRFFKTSCYVQSTETREKEEKCSCFGGGLLCSDTYPCLVIKVLVKAKRKSEVHILYKDLTSYTFSSKCSYYPLGKACTGNNTVTQGLAYKFYDRYRGTRGSNFTCYTNDLENPKVVVAEENHRDAAKLVLFVLSILFFFFPLIAMNCFFFYKWRLVAYLRLTFTRHHRVSVANSIGDNTERRDTAFTTTNFHIE